MNARSLDKPWTSRPESGLAALLDAHGWFWLGTLDIAAGGEALIAQHAQGLDFGALTRAFAVFQYFHIAWTRHAVFVDGAFFFHLGSPQYQQFTDVLNRGCAEFLGKCLEHSLALDAVV